jgi:hypothetical protein
MWGSGVGDIFRGILQATVQDGAKAVQRLDGDSFVFPQVLKGVAVDAVLVPKGIAGDVLCPHCLPETVKNDHPISSLPFA